MYGTHNCQLPALHAVRLLKPRLHEHHVPNPDSNLDHNPYGGGGLSLDLNPGCLSVNPTNLDLDQNPCVNGALVFTNRGVATIEATASVKVSALA